MVRLTGGIRIANSRPVAVRAKGTAAMGVWGACPPMKFFNFRSSEIDSGAFWDDFQHGKARVQTAIAVANLFFYIRSRRTTDRTPP